MDTTNYHRHTGKDGIPWSHGQLQDPQAVVQKQKKLENPPDQWKIFENTHEAIIDEETFARVQELRKNKRRPARPGKTNMFSGLVRRADCGEKLYYCTSNSFETRQDHFVCSTSRKKGKEVCDTHFIRAVVLEEGTLQHMRLVLQCVADYEDAFRRALGAKRSEEAKKELSANLLYDVMNGKAA